jgi:phosphatidylserine decarboxylase
MFHKEGNNIILGTLSICIAIALLTNYFVENAVVRTLILILSILFLILILQFFRNPKRKFTLSDDQVMSPVDGKVVVIEDVFEKEYFNEKRLQVSIFMSPINDHITRYPVSGKVVFSKYHAGKFLVAWHPKSSEENERTTVVVKSNKFGDVLHRQIAGALAKRIVNYAAEGQEVRQTDDSGFIKFGSRVDVFLPLNTKINVKLHQKVKGGITVLASK